ncbi:MAG: ABC transporter substrate binding protein, partial [Salinibacter sp.]
MRKCPSLLLVPLALLLLGATVPPVLSDGPASDGRTRVKDDVGLIQQMFFLQKMKPDLKRIGLIWKKGVANQKAKLKTAKRAVASIGGKLFVGYVEDKSEVADNFRLLTGKHDVQALWIIENDGIVNASAPQKYLTKNAIEEGIPLLAPTQDWVDAGAPLSIVRANGEIQIMLNEPAAKATGL